MQKFGGHDLAAGLSIKPENIDKFREEINAYAKECLTEDDFMPFVYIDSELPVPYINMNTAEKLSILEPYGMGNACPLFYATELSISQIRSLSDGKHLKLVLSSGEHSIEAVGFNMGELLEILTEKDKVDIAFSIDINIYRGTRQLQILLKDVKLRTE